MAGEGVGAGRPVSGLEDLRLAPFHILAAESGAFTERDHAWHLDHCDALVAADPGWIRRTERRFVDLTQSDEEARARRSAALTAPLPIHYRSGRQFRT